MSARELSQQAAAIRKRRQRENERARAQPPVTSPAPSSEARPTGSPLVSVPAPADAAPIPEVTRDVTPIASSPRFVLLETEPVTGDGAEAYAGETVLGADDAGAGGTPLVTPEPPAEARKTTPEEAAAIGKAIAMYCSFGWGELVTKHRAELAVLVPDPTMQQKLFIGGLELVEKSATNLAIKYNVRIPWGDELAVGVGVGVATLGIAGRFKKPKDGAPAPANDNARPATEASSSAPPSSARVSRATEPDIDTSPSARAQRDTGEIVELG